MKKLFMRIFGGPIVHGHQTLSAWKLGAGFLVGVLIMGWAVFNRTELITWFTPGETIRVNFASDYRLNPYFSKVKVAFVPVGIVTGVDRQDDGTSMVDVKLFGDSRDRLGSAPSAVVRPTTLLGGNYFVDLLPGGDKGRFTDDLIPKERTKLPVELDKIVATMQPDALQGMRGTLAKFDNTLAGGGREALQRLFHDAPGGLKPGGEVLTSLAGHNPDDLTKVVDGFEAMAKELSEPKGRLDNITTDFATLSTVLGNNGANFTATLDDLPGTLHSANRAFRRLNTTLDVLHDTAEDVRPSAQELDHTLDRIDPILHDARPVVRDLRDILDDARPLLRRLVPDVRELRDVLDDLHGKTLDRVNGPIADLILNPYKGKGAYAQTATDKKVYQELGYAVATLDRALMQNKNGSALPFQAAAQPEVEGAVANNGQPRSETLLRSLTDPNRINPPIQSPGKPPHANYGSAPGLLPFLGGTTPTGGGK